MNLTQIETRSAAKVVEGVLYGVVHRFGTRAFVGGQYEEFSATAFNAILKNPDKDIAAFWNHDRSLLLGRLSSGTLRLEADDEELRFEVDLPDTTVGNDVRVLAERGDIGGTSFGFLPGKAQYFSAPDGRKVRRHIEVGEFFEISPVSLPAFAGTSVAIRGQEFVVESIDSQLVRARARALEIH